MSGDVKKRQRTRQYLWVLKRKKRPLGRYLIVIVMLLLVSGASNRRYLHLDFANLKRFISTQYPDQLNAED
jgi:hypothetical protein